MGRPEADIMGGCGGAQPPHVNGGSGGRGGAPPEHCMCIASGLLYKIQVEMPNICMENLWRSMEPFMHNELTSIDYS